MDQKWIKNGIKDEPTVGSTDRSLIGYINGIMVWLIDS